MPQQKIEKIALAGELVQAAKVVLLRFGMFQLQCRREAPFRVDHACSKYHS